MKTTLLIQLLKKGGWRQNRKVNNDLVFTHPDYTNLISVPDMEEQEIKPELLNEIFQAARLKARIHKITVSSPANLLTRLKSLFNSSVE